MKEFQIIVPHWQVCKDLLVNDKPGYLLRAVQTPGQDYVIQTWAVPRIEGSVFDVHFKLTPALPEPARVR